MSGSARQRSTPSRRQRSAHRALRGAGVVLARILLNRRAAITALAIGATGCPIAPPLSDPIVFDSAPFLFADGVDPSVDEDVILDLATNERQTFTVDVYDWEAGDTLTYRWTLVSDDLQGSLGNGELRDPSPIGDAFAYRVPPTVIDTCGVLLGRDGDTLTLELEITDEIPEAQRFDPAADAYRLTLSWQVRASGECP